MKNIKYLFLFIGLITTIGCESFLADDINVDPNKPISVPVNAILPSIQIRLADNYGGDFSRFNTMISQHVEGVARQWTSFNNYSGLTPNRFDNAWETFYEDVMIEAQVMITQAEEDGYNHYVGIGKIMQAFALMNATDVWGDIPYTESILGIENTNPAFDNQTSVIYPAIFNLLTSAKTNLAASDGGRAVGSDDVIYGGDVDKWISAANAIAARGHLHQGNYVQALSNAQNSFASAGDNLSFTYTATKQGPWWRFNDGRTGDLEFHPTLRKMMTDLNDTDRLVKWDQTFITSHPYLKDTYRQDLVSYREMQFVIAECLIRTSGSATAIETAYLKGIKASFIEAGLTEANFDTYAAQSAVNPGAANIKLNDHILTQKYIGLFVQPEVFNDLRRNDFPVLTPTSGTQIPKRWNYSADEILFNSNAPKAGETTIYSPPVGWDN